MIYQLSKILDTARCAPSVHNTQPWKVRSDGTEVIVSLDPEHTLQEGDPTGRQTTISLGIFAEAFRIGAEANAVSIVNMKLEDRELIISLSEGDNPGKSSPEVKLLKSRATDRSIYKPVNIPKELTEELNNAATSDSIEVHVVTDRGKLSKIAELTQKGISLAMSNPKFRSELTKYLVLPWSKSRRGIAVKSLYLSTFLEIMQPIFLKMGWGLQAESKTERRRWDSASAVVVITASGDSREYWFEAGRTYLKTSLAIEGAGLAQATSAAVVEASTFHEDIEALIDTNKRILCMLRIGNGASNRYYSPRVSADELLH